MRTHILNFTTFDLQLWPPPLKIGAKAPIDYPLNPSLCALLLLIYHAIVSIALRESMPGLSSLSDFPDF